MEGAKGRRGREHEASGVQQLKLLVRRVTHLRVKRLKSVGVFHLDRVVVHIGDLREHGVGVIGNFRTELQVRGGGVHLVMYRLGLELGWKGLRGVEHPLGTVGCGGGLGWEVVGQRLAHGRLEVVLQNFLLLFQ